MRLDSRFSEIFSSSSTRMENRALWRGEHAVVVPTLGMIVPNWFLIIPQVHTLNFAQQAITTRQEVSTLAATIFDTVADIGDELLVFEHGSQHTGSSVGCGLDHAHVHVLVAPSALVDAIWSAMEVELQVRPTATKLDDLYQDTDAEQSYYMSWRDGRQLLEQPARQEVSQRFRRIIAAAASVPDLWDYQEYSFHDNIANTVAAVRQRILLAA